MVRPLLPVRVLRKLARKPEADEVIATADPAPVQTLEPGQTGVWRVKVPELSTPRLLPPSIWRPLGDGSQRPIRPSQLLVRIDRSLYRPWYLRYRCTSPFQRRIWPLSGVLPHLVQDPLASSHAAPATPVPTTTPTSAPPGYRPAVMAGIAGFILGAVLRSIFPKLLLRCALVGSLAMR
jgi:hypothetical protein